MIDGHWLSLSHLGYNCMKYLSGLSTSYPDALTIISPNVFPWKRLNYFQRSCASPLQCRKKCIHKLLNWHRWGPEWQSSWLQIPLPRHVLSDGGTGRGSGGATLVMHEHDWWFLLEEEVDRLLIHTRALESDRSDKGNLKLISLRWYLSTALPISTWMEQA